MTKINVITPPDILHNQNQSILLIYPSTELRQEFQKYLEVVGKSVNVYLYDPTDEEVDIAWLLALAKICEIVILDLDQMQPLEKNFASYLISLPNTFYLTKDDVTPYNKLSLNRVYDLNWLIENNEGQNEKP
jgi:hypothetical protein|tara:strand:+ start:1311 stop:1706 length:396 start_codon:yes stop_codon:yes gene_type:complete